MMTAWGLLAAGAADELRTIGAIRNLSPEQIRLSPPCELTARVTFIAVWNGRSEISVQDDTAGIYTFVRKNETGGLALGDELRINGHVTAGVGPPCLEVDTMFHTGVKGLPEPTKADFAALERGSVDSQFVELEGVVRDVQYDPAVAPPSTILTLQMRGGRAEVFLAMKSSPELEELVDAEVRVRGVPFHYFNQSRQPFGVRVMSCEESQIEVMKAAPQPPFDMPVTRVEQLLRYQPGGQWGHRVRVRGIVTLHWPGEFLYLQDGAVGILVKSRRKEALKPGDVIEVAAFAAMSGYSAILEDADFRKVGTAGVPEVVDLPLDKLESGDEDARLVSTEGVLESISERNDRALLMIRKGPLIVPAEMPVAMAAMPSIELGSRVRITGVCQVELGSRRKFAVVYRPESARILLRSATDVSVIQPGPWWNPKRLQLALGTAAAVLALAAVWLWSLQSRNARLKREITAREKAEAEVKRREEERKIFAADLHDSLEQSLTGVALQLQAAGKSGGKDPHIELAGRLLKHSRDEVHRAVRDLREPADEDFDLRAAIQGLVRRSAAGSAVDFQLDLPERMPVMGPHLSHQLLHLAQEGVTNALKHADAASIRISLEEKADGMLLEIEDDGVGFNPSSRPGPADGHFGLQGMKERAARSGGTFGIDSATGEGTRIQVVLPMKS